MPVMIQGKTVNGVAIGGETFVKTDGWILLQTGNGFSGRVWFKDNGDGTASLDGTIQADNPKGDMSLPMLLPPSGYKFVETNWGAPGQPSHYISVFKYTTTDVGTKFFKMIDANRGYLEHVSWQNQDGILYCRIDQSDINAYDIDGVFMVFTDFMTNNALNGNAGPAVINIEKI